MYKIKKLNKIAACGTDLFDKAKYEVSDDVQSPDAIIVRSASMHDMEFDDNLLAIARAGAGVNNIPVADCAEKGICVFNTPGANANAVKELAVLGLLISSRKVSEAIEWAKGLKGNGAEVGKMVEKGKSQFVGPEIMGKTLGLVGLGAIGGKLANVAVSLGMNVIGYDPFLSVSAALHLKPQVTVVKDVDEVYSKADYLSLHLPYNSETKGSINADVFAKMKDGARLLNFARGELVDTSAVIEALGSGKLAKYVTDFPNDEVIGVEGVVAIPHLGASTPESEDNCAVMASRELIDYIENGNIVNSVNFPNVELNKTGDVMVCIMHKNVPEFITKITAIISKDGANIENFVHKSKGEYAYSMIDITGSVDVEALKANADVIRVRTL
ncbi:MAG: 3-phosphoglycerate dehydrogenase family protein [Ruminococcus sp.]|nr:3-phosphoglycerate dehydrogenase family protein [Ruminococcus sp.]MCD7773030.1 3-phosphoglycerate dehydrogenase family protein [Ruminococcus sp.]